MFAIFPQLPPELQLTVWETAASETSIINVEAIETGPCEPPQITLKSEGWDPLVLGSVCHDSRGVVEQRFQTISLPSTVSYQTMGQQTHHVDFSSAMFYFEASTSHLMQYSDLAEAYGTKLQYAAIQFVSWVEAIRLLNYLAGSFSALKAVFIYTGDARPSISPQTLMEKEDMEAPLPETMVEEFRGCAAMMPSREQMNQSLGDRFKTHTVKPRFVILS